jgi:hypothetical protein
MTPEQVARLKSEVIKITPPQGYKDKSASGAIKTTHKPGCIWHFLTNYDHDALYIDADVMLLEPLTQQDFSQGDVCVTPRHRKEMLSKTPFLNGTLNAGVIFFKNTPAVQNFVALWEAECRVDDKSDQMALSDILTDAKITSGPGIGKAHGLAIQKMPAAIYNDVRCATGKLWHFKNAGRRSSKTNKRAIAIFVTNKAPSLMRLWLAYKRRKLLG